MNIEFIKSHHDGYMIVKLSDLPLESDRYKYSICSEGMFLVQDDNYRQKVMEYVWKEDVWHIYTRYSAQKVTNILKKSHKITREQFLNSREKLLMMEQLVK